jgi:23S rRNA (adenine2030-N6)-methyltransferase
MNYRHSFHAGNFADVLKHSVLLLVLKHMLKKPKPLSYFESHAGAGRYLLGDRFAERTPEYVAGIERLLHAKGLRADALDYLKLVMSFNGESLVPTLKTYPGSPMLAASILRPEDQLFLCELEPETLAQLRASMRADARVHVHARDGYEALRALTPPKPPYPRRGLILIDPPYERADDFERARAVIHELEQRWPEAAVMVWYPIKRKADLLPFLRKCTQLRAERLLSAELCVQADDTALSLNGSGVLLVNPPFGIEASLQALLDQLKRVLCTEPAGRADLFDLR